MSSLLLAMSLQLLAPEGYSKSELDSIGFIDAVTIADFPLRERPCSYNVRRHKWFVKRSYTIQVLYRGS